MEKVRRRFQYLFQREKPHPPGLSLAIHVEPANMNYEVPSEAEVEAAARRLFPHRAGGHTHLHAEQFKQWQREAYPGDQSNKPSRRERWLCLVDILHHMWRTEEIPKGYGMDYPSPNSKMDHGHTGYGPGRDPAEGGGGVDRHLSMIKPLDSQRLAWVQGQKRDGGGYNGFESFSRYCQHRPVPPLPGIPEPKEGL